MASEGAAEKGWVRERILDSLSKEPATLTEISDRLEVSKSTASYHVSKLLQKGVVEVVSERSVRGGVVSKKYALSQGSLVLLPSASQEEEELRLLREALELEMLSWGRHPRPDGPALERLLYRLFLHLFKVSRSEHYGLMAEYGRAVGVLLSKEVGGKGVRETLAILTRYLSKNGVADADLVEVPDSANTVIVLGTCLGSRSHLTNACYFVEGLVRGVVQSADGMSARVERISVPGVASCCLAVGRARSLDKDAAASALLSSPMSSRAAAAEGGL